LNLLLFALLALDMGGAARDLAHSAAAAAGHEPVILTARNLSALGPGEVAGVRRVFESELRSAGVRLAGTPSAAELQVTISEDLSHYLLIAELRRGPERQVFMASWPRSPASSQPLSPQVRLERKLLWEQDEPVLDVAQSGDMTLVLDPTRVLVVRGAEQQSVAIPAARVWPRDIRGRLSIGGPAFTAWLPGTVCRGSLQPRLSMECRDSSEPWLLAPGAIAAFAAARNFFEGRADIESWGGHDVPPFYSAAGAGGAWIFAGTDGRVRLYTRPWQAAGSIEQWGSDVAAIETPCGPRILATLPGSGAERDAIRSYSLIEGSASPAGPPLEFAGPVTALWSGGNSAVAVSRDLQSGRYAAFSLVPACGS
jgi:hypothetical protein